MPAARSTGSRTLSDRRRTGSSGSQSRENQTSSSVPARTEAETCDRRISHPRDRSLQSEIRQADSDASCKLIRQLPRRTEACTRDSRKESASRACPRCNARGVPRNQVQRQLIQQAIEAIRRKCRGERLPRRSSHQSRHPLQPRRVVYRRSHPFRVKRLSAKSCDAHFTGVISCISSQGKKTI